MIRTNEFWKSCFTIALAILLFGLFATSGEAKQDPYPVLLIHGMASSPE